MNVEAFKYHYFFMKKYIFFHSRQAVYRRFYPDFISRTFLWFKVNTPTNIGKRFSLFAVKVGCKWTRKNVFFQQIEIYKFARIHLAIYSPNSCLLLPSPDDNIVRSNEYTLSLCTLTNFFKICCIKIWRREESYVCYS